MRFMDSHFALCIVLSGSFWIVGQRSSARSQERGRVGKQAEASYRLVTTPNGVRFGLRGDNRGSPAPVAFIFGSLLRESLTEGRCRILRGLGFVCVALDAPGHGSDRVSDEPPELRSWRHRVNAGNNFVATFNKKLSRVLDYLIAKRIADPKRIVAVGGSRGGFLAFHFAANDARVKGVAGLAPVTDLRALVEFDGMNDHALTQALSARRHAQRLGGRNVLVVIGDRDERVGTDRAIAFARQVSKMAKRARVALHVLPEPRGHAHPPGTNRILKEWAKSCFTASKPRGE